MPCTHPWMHAGREPNTLHLCACSLGSKAVPAFHACMHMPVHVHWMFAAGVPTFLQQEFPHLLVRDVSGFSQGFSGFVTLCAGAADGPQPAGAAVQGPIRVRGPPGHSHAGRGAEIWTKSCRGRAGRACCRRARAAASGGGGLTQRGGGWYLAAGNFHPV